MTPKQMSLSMQHDASFERHRKPTRRDVFLAEMDQVVPWAELCAIIEPYLLSHGGTKLVVLVEIVRGRLWAYPELIVLTALFAAYQIYYMAATSLSASYLALTLFDLLIIALTTLEYAKLHSRSETISNFGHNGTEAE